MSFQEAVTHVFQNYANFNGRARRSEFWYFYLFVMLVNLVLSILTSITTSGGDGNFLSLIVSLLTLVFSLGTLVPNLAVSVRRLHDIGKSGWYYLICLVPFVGIILLIVWMARDSDPGENMYGPNPKQGNVFY